MARHSLSKYNRLYQNRQLSSHPARPDVKRPARAHGRAVIAPQGMLTVLQLTTILLSMTARAHADADADELSLDGLLAAARDRLEKAGLASANGDDGRVSPLPDARTVRYYATLGLVDRPAIQGKAARYARRHLLQVLAIKALQAAGLRLADVQQRLYGRSNRELEAIVEAGLKPRPVHAQRPIVWREVVIEPGLKLVADEHWAASLGPPALEQKFRAAIEALRAPTSRHREGDDQ